ncbi:MAG: protein kinase [Acidobacteriia bacterium]|nr:protein kinase [Terriglobia bacterium]
MVSTTLSHFQILSKLGEGGMGEVYRALDTKLGREVAIKILPRTLLSDPDRLDRFEKEARAAAALTHPNIVTIYSIEEAEDLRFITMELVRGILLSKLIPEQGLPLRGFFRLAIPMADAVSAAHERSIIHCDLKPDNIIVTHEGRVKILDFGLARTTLRGPFLEEGELPTRPIANGLGLWGTLSYMSPEQIEGKELDHRTDIFSLGVILFEMVTGRRPFRAKTTAEMIASILKDTPPLVNDLKPGLPRQLGRIIRHCLEKDIRKRLQMALDLRNELEALEAEVGAGSEELPSIAVVPFTDMSQEKDQDYFCKGIAEEIISFLSKIKDLNVVSRMSSFQVDASKVDSREIGRQLGVSTLLEGSVRKAGDQIRITVQLINVADGYTLWSERFDREFKDIFAIQDEIASSIARVLKITLSPKERHVLRKIPTANATAYDYYLRGRHFYYDYNKRTVETAVRMFSRAIEIDTRYANAYAGLADCCAYLFMYGGRMETHRTQADGASEKALQLDPESAEANASRALARALLDQYEEAETLFENAIRLDPRLFEAYYFYARTCFTQGKAEKALELYEKAMEVRPEDYQAPLLVAQIYDDLGRPADAERARRRGVDLVESRLNRNPEDVRALYMGANGLVALGENEKGLEWARQALAMDPDEPMVLYNVACIQSLAGRIEEAIDSLERSVQKGLLQKSWLEHDSNLDPLRSHPRFQAVVGMLGKGFVV